MRILFVDRPHPLLAQLLEQDGNSISYMLSESAEDVGAALERYDGLVCKSRIRLDRPLLDKGRKLRFIARAGVGVDHIDTDYATQLGIPVLTSPEGSRDTVAEHTMGLILGLMNNLVRADREVRQGQWIRAGNTGHELKGKTVGILGYGNMGQALARRLSGFGCRVITWDKYKSEYGDEWATRVSLEAFFAETEVLSIHIYYIPDNHHFINGTFLDRFARKLWVINTARGLVLHTADLVAALERGKVNGAALDVIEYEEFSFENLRPDELPGPFQTLRKSPKVVLSPHIAGWSVESMEAHARVLYGKIKGVVG